jgi:hypothetical protein
MMRRFLQAASFFALIPLLMGADAVIGIKITPNPSGTKQKIQAEGVYLTSLNRGLYEVYFVAVDTKTKQSTMIRCHATELTYGAVLNLTPGNYDCWAIISKRKNRNEEVACPILDLESKVGESRKVNVDVQ